MAPADLSLQNAVRKSIDEPQNTVGTMFPLTEL
jgi:hypothetical protein